MALLIQPISVEIALTTHPIAVAILPKTALPTAPMTPKAAPSGPLRKLITAVTTVMIPLMVATITVIAVPTMVETTFTSTFQMSNMKPRSPAIVVSIALMTALSPAIATPMTVVITPHAALMMPTTAANTVLTTVRKPVTWV